MDCFLLLVKRSNGCGTLNIYRRKSCVLCVLTRLSDIRLHNCCLFFVLDSLALSHPFFPKALHKLQVQKVKMLFCLHYKLLVIFVFRNIVFCSCLLKASLNRISAVLTYLHWTFEACKGSIAPLSSWAIARWQT